MEKMLIIWCQTCGTYAYLWGLRSSGLVMSQNCISDRSYVLSYLCSGTVAVICNLECKTSVDFYYFLFPFHFRRVRKVSKMDC